MSVQWSQGGAYDRFMGRWSRLVARQFLEWLEVPAGSDWLDVGCGTGILLDSIGQTSSPRRLAGVDPSSGFLAVAAERLSGRAELSVGDAQDLPFADGEFDAVVSGLVLNFVANPVLAVGEMRRVSGPGGMAAAYVWDYADGMEFLRRFWDVATELDPGASELEQSRRFPICRPEPLRELFAGAGLASVTVTAIEVPTTFGDFDDYWQPFLGGQGPAPTYVAALTDEKRDRLEDRLRLQLPRETDGSIHLRARAWAVKGAAEG